MVSEDSQVLRGFAVVHRFHDLGDRAKTCRRQVDAFGHHLNHGRELLEVVALRRSQRMFHEEWNDRRPEIVDPLYAVTQEIFPMVVSASVQVHLAAPEELNELLEDVPAGCTLNYCELRSNLPTEGHRWASEKRAAETALAIHEADDPTVVSESFLLVFRRDALYVTRHRIFTAHTPITYLIEVTGMNEYRMDAPGFPAYSQLHSPPSPAGGAAPHCL